MKFIVLNLLLALTIPVSFAQQCKVNNSAAISPIINLAKSGFSSTCMLQREQYKCSDLESELEGDEKKKIIQCDSKSIEENKLSNISLTSCVWNGMKLSGEQLLDLAKLPGQIAEMVAKGFHETQLCNASIDKKRELLTAYNLTISDKRFTLSEQFLGRWLEDASCAEIDKLLWARYQNYQNVLMNERIAAINTGKKPAALDAKEDKVGPGIIELLKSAMSAAQVRYECYTPKVKAEMICAGVTSLIVDTAMGMGIKSAVTKISSIVKSKKALANINRAVAAGEKTHLTDAAKLTNADRKRAALVLLNENLAAGAPKRILSEAEENALIKAHEVGKPRSYFTYTKEDIAEKARLLKEAGFTSSERRLLMENGIAGEITDQWTINAITNHYKKVLGQAALTPEKSAAIIKLESAGSTTSQAFAKLNAREILEKSGFSKEEIDAILAAKKAEEMRLAKGLPYKEPVAAVAKVAAKTNAVSKPTATAAADAVEQTVTSAADKAEKMTMKDALAEAEKLRLPKDSRGMRLKVNGKEVVAGPVENEASSEYLLRAAKLEREAAEEAYRKKNRTLKADVSYMNKYVENALEASLKGDGTVAKKIVQDAMKGNGNTMRDMNELVTHLYQNAYEFPNATEAQKALSQLRKANLKKVLEEIKAQKGDSLLTNGNNSVFRSMLGGVSSN